MICSKFTGLPIRRAIHRKLVSSQSASAVHSVSRSANIARQCPNLHYHHPSRSSGLLLPQEHRRTPSRGITLVERGQSTDWGITLGVREQ